MMRSGGLVASFSRRLLSTAASSPAAARGHPLPPGLQLPAARALLGLGSHVAVDMSVCGCLQRVSASECSSAINIGSASLNPYQHLPFSAFPLYALPSQVQSEKQTDGSGNSGEQTKGNWSAKVADVSSMRLHGQDKARNPTNQLETGENIGDTGKGDEGIEGNQPRSRKDEEWNKGNAQGGGNDDGGIQGNNTGGGNGRGRNWDGYENFLLHVLLEQRKAQSIEFWKLLDGNQKLRDELGAFRNETNDRIHKLEVLVTKSLLKVLIAIIFVLVAAAQYAFTPTGKALWDRLTKLWEGDTKE